MPRYIDADAALKRFKELHGNESDLLNCYNADWIVSFIETQPTADVQEVQHGRWIRATTHGSYTCSICGAMDTDCDDYYGVHCVLDQQYCPDCGAKMGLED